MKKYKKRKNILLRRSFHYFLVIVCLMLISQGIKAQEADRIHGKIVDEKGDSLPGATITIKRTNANTQSDSSGLFSIVAEGRDTLVVNFVGYNTKEIPVDGKRLIDVNLTSVASNLNEVIVVGYGTQRRQSLTSAVSSITSTEIVTTKNENVQNMLTGKVPGLRVVQNTSEPGSFDNSFNIRGMGSPLVIIDGVPRDNMTRLDPNDVESISVLKDASAAIYGVRAANGVVLITTKKGKRGTMELNYSGNYGLQVPSGLPKSIDAIEYMTLYNEQTMHNVNGGHISFTDEDFAPYLNGTAKSTNWYDAVIKSSAAQQQHNLNASGGNEKLNYFFSLGYTSQDGIFKSNDLTYKRYNVRSDITAKITDNLSVELNMTGIMDQKDQPYSDAWWIIRSFWRQLPTQTVYANNNPDYLNNGLVDGTNPVALSNSDIVGYKRYTNRWFQSSITLNYKIPFVTGLNFKALYSYDYNTSDNKAYQKAYTQYQYDASSDTYIPFVNQSPSTVRREYYSFPSDLEQLSLNYSNRFGNAHNVTGLLLYEQSGRSADNFYAQRELALAVDQLLAGNSLNQQGYMDPGSLYKNANKAIVGRVAYDFRSKYLAEFSFRQDGSSKFGPGKQWGFFPSFQLGWRLSDENFWKNSKYLSVVSDFKVRASYGKLGDDGASSYQFITGYTYPAGGDNNTLPGGSVFDGTFTNAVASTGLANPNITWYTSKTFDLGLDASVLHNLFGITVDYFSRFRTGLLATRGLSLPDVVGASLPQENLNSDRTRGYEIEIRHNNNIGEFNYNIKANFSYTRTMNRYIETAKAGNSYLNWRGNSNNRYNNAYWGYGSTGRYENYGDIVNSPIYVGRGTVVGDYIYEDWNGDGQIDDNDVHPIGYTGDPLITYGISIGGSYKGFDFNLLFQGAAKQNVSYFEQLNTPLWGGGSALAQFMDRYHPADPNADPYDPNTVWVPGNFGYTGSIPYQNSPFNMQNGAYLRLKSAELGYTLPTLFLSHIGIKAVRFYMNGYNIVTWTKLKYVDPEHPSGTYGYLYPLDRLYSFGVNVKF